MMVFGGTSDSTSTTASSGLIWPTWVVSTSLTCSSDPWPRWVTTTGSSTADNSGGWVTVTWPGWIDNHERAREDLQRREARRRREQQRWLERQREAKQEKRVARKRARRILAEHLNRTQRRTLEKLGYFDVTAKGRTFRIHNNRYQHNVFELDAQGQPIREFCAHTSHACPQDDHALAQKLMLENSLEEFCRVANVWDLRQGRRMVSASRRELALN